MLSQAVGKPVRVQLSRKDEMAWENYGNLFAIDQRAGIDANGSIVAWDYEAWSAAKGGRPGYNTPGNVVTGTLLGLNPAPFNPRTPAPAPTQPLNNNSNTAPSYIAGRVQDSRNGAGVVRSERVLSHRVRSPFFTGPLRAPERLQNTFAHECFMDEVAAHVKADPVEYRLRHLNHARLRGRFRRRPRPPTGRRDRHPIVGRVLRPKTRRHLAAAQRSAAAASPASATKATTATSRWSPRSTSIRAPVRST